MFRNSWRDYIQTRDSYLLIWQCGSEIVLVAPELPKSCAHFTWISSSPMPHNDQNKTSLSRKEQEMIFTGVLTALVTPFKANAIDEEAYRAFIEWQIASGIHGLVPCGTTGESATLTHAEHERVIEICIDQAAGRVPVLAGAGSNNTTEAIALAKFAKNAGADGALLITPYYNKPTQQGLYDHYSAIAKAVDLPLVPYNVPGRTGCNMLPPVVAKLAKEFSNIVAIKEATGDMKQASELFECCPSRFNILSGDDLTALPLIALGGNGIISVTSNIVPDRIVGMCNAALTGDMPEARAAHHALFPLSKAMFMVSNPIPVKTALALMGKMSAEMRLPLCPMNENDLAALKQILVAQKLLQDHEDNESADDAPASMQ